MQVLGRFHLQHQDRLTEFLDVGIVLGKSLRAFLAAKVTRDRVDLGDRCALIDHFGHRIRPVLIPFEGLVHAFFVRREFSFVGDGPLETCQCLHVDPP